jgi:hypothetical protein
MGVIVQRHSEPQKHGFPSAAFPPEADNQIKSVFLLLTVFSLRPAKIFPAPKHNSLVNQ